MLYGSRWEHYTTGGGGACFFLENRGGGVREEFKREEVCAELAKHPMKGGYEFPLGCKELEEGWSSVVGVRGGGGLRGDSLRKCGTCLTPPATQSGGIYTFAWFWQFPIPRGGVWVCVGVCGQVQQGGASPGVMLLFCHYSKWKICLSMEKKGARPKTHAIIPGEAAVQAVDDREDRAERHKDDRFDSADLFCPLPTTSMAEKPLSETFKVYKKVLGSSVRPVAQDSSWITQFLFKKSARFGLICKVYDVNNIPCNKWSVVCI